MNAVAFVACIASGAALPIMDIVFGRFVNVFNGFAAGTLSPAGYRSEVGKFRCDRFSCPPSALVQELN